MAISAQLRVAAIDFLNPAPLMWDFEHPPLAASLAGRYTVGYTEPSTCARQLLSGEAELGLIPVAALTPELAIVPGSVIASRDQVRSILILVKRPHTLDSVRSVVADTASESSVAYLRVLLQRFHGNDPEVIRRAADPVSMLVSADAALLIGDPALLARERRAEIEAATGPLLWIDLAEEWRRHTGLPWVAAVWAVRPEALTAAGAAQLTSELNGSRDHGLEHIDDLVREWTPRIALPPATIRQYLTQNIHYYLDSECIRAVVHFRRLAAELKILPPLDPLRFLPVF